MADKSFDLKLIPEFNGTAMSPPYLNELKKQSLFAECAG